MTELIRVLVSVCEIMGNISDGILEHEKWFMGIWQSV